MKNTITPFLWFNGNVGKALKFYKSIFKNVKISDVSEYKGKVFSASIKMNNQWFVLFDGGDMFKFNESISFSIECHNQKEVDYFWNKLSKGGKKSQCGWLKDPFGVSWQVTPTVLHKLLGHKDREKADRVHAAMMKMQKIDIKKLKNA